MELSRAYLLRAQTAARAKQIYDELKAADTAKEDDEAFDQEVGILQRIQAQNAPKQSKFGLAIDSGEWIPSDVLNGHD